MKKTRQFRNPAPGVPVDHPDGGTYRLIPLDIQRSAELQDALDAIEYEKDEGGNVRLGDDGAPVVKGWQPTAERLRERLHIIRKFCVAGVENFVDADKPTNQDGSPNFIMMTDEMIEQDMGAISVRLVERQVPVTVWDEEAKKFLPKRDEAGKILTESKSVPANEPIFQWVMERAMELGSVGGAEEKNSSSTLSGPSVTPAQ